MTSKNTLIIGTRGSALALAQADMVRAALSLRYPELDVRREIIHTTGDRRTDVPLADVARVSGIVDKGIFIKELETALLEGRIDVAVHSLKDVPSELAPGFTLAAVLPRAAVEDVLITREPDWNGSGTLATGSVRRRLMARTYWGSGLRFEDLRGNVPTRLAKLAEHPGWDAVILARAGLERLGLYAPETLVEGALQAPPAGGSLHSRRGAGHRGHGMPLFRPGDDGNAGRSQRSGSLRLRSGGTRLPGAPGSELFHARGRLRPFGRA